MNPTDRMANVDIGFGSNRAGQVCLGYRWPDGVIETWALTVEEALEYRDALSDAINHAVLGQDWPPTDIDIDVTTGKDTSSDGTSQSA